MGNSGFMDKKGENCNWLGNLHQAHRVSAVKIHSCFSFKSFLIIISLGEIPEIFFMKLKNLRIRILFVPCPFLFLK